MIEPLLAVLADGKFHSGQALGKVLGVSRSAIWKQIKTIEESGLEIYSVKGRGYRIPGGLDLLHRELIEEALEPEVSDALNLIDLSLIIPSTNAKAMEAVYRDGHGSLYLAEQQTSGRGRRGRSWASPFASNLYFSLTWQFSTALEPACESPIPGAALRPDDRSGTTAPLRAPFPAGRTSGSCRWSSWATP